MKIFTREYVETLAYTSISAFAVGRILEMLVDYDITKQSLEDESFTINQ